MASTGINNGTLTALYIFVANVPTKVAHLTSTGFSVNMNTRSVTTKDSAGWEEILEGSKSWEMSASGYFAEDTTLGYEELFDYWNGRGKVLVAFTSAVTGDKRYKGLGYITSLSRTAPTEDSETFDVTIQGTSTITKYTVS
jgi:TP901-1 family phage major tail protein